MRSDVGYYDPTDIDRDVVVYLWKGARVKDIILKTGSPTTNLSGMVSSLSVSSSKVSLILVWSDEFLTCSAQPVYGDFISVEVDGLVRMIAMVATMDSIEESRGVRRISLTARTSDGLAGWKDYKASSSVYPIGIALSTIAEDVLKRLFGLDQYGYEYSIPASPYVVAHSNAQLSELSPWEMLETLYLPLGYKPMMNALNQVSYVSKDLIGRDTDVVVESENLVKISGSRSEQRTDRIQISWLDPNLTKSLQADQVLNSATITAGFFDWHQTQEVFFSSDRTQRAQDTYMVIKESCNSGLVPVADEDYEERDEYHGHIELTSTGWVPALATASLATRLAAASQEDGVQTVPATGTGVTIPIGRIVEAAADVGIMLAMMSIGTGMYEIWGRPYTMVHARNKTLIVAAGASPWMRNVTELENDFISSESHAQEVGIRELTYQALEASSWGADVVDDPRIEVGDIVQIGDYGRLYVSGWSLELARGSKATLSLQGFKC
jgi:hypothetical protein